MSKGSNRRPTDEKAFKNNYDKIKWGRKSGLVEIKTPTGYKYVHKSALEKKAKSHHIIPDIEPYQAVGPEAGKYITSRSKEREYLRRHNLIQVGNEKEYFFKHGGKTPDNPTKDWGE